MKLRGILLTTLLLAGCGQSQPAHQENGSLLIPNEANPHVPPPPSPHPPPSQPAIDPGSAEGAAQVVQDYGALIEQGRWTRSWTLWSRADAARQFDRNWREDSEVHLEIGKPGDVEGAAGSLYVTVPVAFYGRTKNGASFRRPANIILRRVNDVPGSTEEQRRWHIERVDWSS